MKKKLYELRIQDHPILLIDGETREELWFSHSDKFLFRSIKVRWPDSTFGLKVVIEMDILVNVEFIISISDYVEEK